MTRSYRLCSRLTLLSFALLASGCAGLRPGLAGSPCPVEWAATADIDRTAAPRQARVQLRAQGREMRLELVTQVRTDEIVVVGLAGYGARLFTIRQIGRSVVVESAASRELEFVAEWLMDALHRSFWIEPTDRDAAGAGIWGEERVIDTPSDQAGALGREARRFELRGAGPDRERVTIAYPGFDSGGGAASGVQSDSSLVVAPEPHRKATLRIRNPWCGYEAILAPL